MPQPTTSVRTLVELLRLRAQHTPDAVAYTFLNDREGESQSLRYQELEAAARRAASQIRERLEPGDRALLLYPPGLDYVAAFFGCLYAEVIAVPAYPPRARRALPRLMALARESGARAALTNESLGATLVAQAEAIPGAGDLHWIVTSVNAGGPLAEYVEVEADNIAFLQYTSGSTSSPKGVVLTHGNLLDNLRHICQRFGQGPDNRGVIWLPPYHDMGLIGGILEPLYAGFPVTLMSPFAFLQRPLRWLEAISRLRATTSGGPNFAYQLLADRTSEEQVASLDLSCWELAFTGAEPVRPATLQRFVARFAPAGFRSRAFYPCYGLAEATLMVSGGRAGTGATVQALERAGLEQGLAVTPADGDETRELVACGAVVDGHELVIVEPTTRVALADGIVGEIWVRGPSVAHGYWNRPEESAELLRATRADTGEGPYLRTGDLGFLNQGTLFVTGRIKDLILVGGRNLYPHDVELTVEDSYQGLRPGCAAAFAVEGDTEEQLVVVQELERDAIRKLDTDAAFHAILHAVAGEHEVQIAAIVLVKPGAIPKTSSGKVQRATTRQQFLAGELEPVAEWRPSVHRCSVLDLGNGHDTFVPARTPIEESLAEIWAEVLNRDAVGVHDDFFEWGGQSLLAAQVLARVSATFGLNLPLRALFEAPTIAQLADTIEIALGSESRDTQVITPLPPGQPVPLAYSQERMWFVHQLQPDSAAYNLAIGLRFRGALDPEVLRRTIHRLVQRHESLRTRIVTVDGTPEQVVEPELSIELALEDLRNLPTATRQDEMRRRIRLRASAPFDLTRLPLARFALLKIDDDENVLAVIMHHVVSDAWSYAVLLRELAAVYAAYARGEDDPLAPLEIQYGDFAAWQRDYFKDDRVETQLDYWRERLVDLPVLSLPTDHPRLPIQRGRGGLVTVEPNPRLLEGLRTLGRKHNNTLFMTSLAAFAVLMHRYTGQHDFAIGVPVANRHHRSSEALIGTLVNTLAMRFDTSDDPTFDRFLTRVRESALAAFSHQDVPFEQLVKRLDLARDLSHGALFQVMFDFINVAAPETAIGDLTWSIVDVDRGASQFDLTLMVIDTHASQRFSLEYDSDLFEHATIERMMAAFLTLLEDLIADPTRPLSQLQILPAQERRLLQSWNDTAIDYPRDQCLDELLSAQAKRSPDACAVRHGDRMLSYRELDQRSDALARHLLGLGVGPNVPVGLCLERSAEMVMALLGVLKTGAAYLPLDPAFPRHRLLYMLADSAAPVLITHSDLLVHIVGDSEDQRALVLIDRDWPAIEAAPEPDTPRATRSAEDLAYLIYTSGSTGKPKGVEVPHRAVVNFLSSMQRLPGLGPDDILLAVTTLSFDIAVLELYLPLMTGATCVLVEREVAYDGYRLAQTLEAVQATAMQATPATWRLLLDAGWSGRPGLKALCGGEALSRDLAQALLPRVGCLWNMYGPTETTVWSTIGQVRSAEGPITVGRPIANTQAYILDQHCQPVPVGVAGELWIGGEGVVRGYRKRPQLTAERFRPDPFSGRPNARMYATGDLARCRPDGDIELLGRLDFQVKVRGFRIELGEIEEALSAIPAVHQAVVSARDDSQGGKHLVAYVLPEPETHEKPPSVSDLRHRLLASLPDYMVPGSFVFLERFPLTPNGKIDRLALPEPETARPTLEQAYEPPGTPFEQTLAEICAELLELDRVGIHDNFFALGGHSLLATRMVSRIHQSLRVELPLRVFFERPTVAELAEYIGEQEMAAMGEEDLAELIAEVRELAPDQLDPPDQHQRRQQARY